MYNRQLDTENIGTLIILKMRKKSRTIEIQTNAFMDKHF